MRDIFIFLLVFWAFFALGCTDRSDGPFQEGKSWTYIIRYSDDKAIDTLHMSIIGSFIPKVVYHVIVDRREEDLIRQDFMHEASFQTGDSTVILPPIPLKHIKGFELAPRLCNLRANGSVMKPKREHRFGGDTLPPVRIDEEYRYLGDTILLGNAVYSGSQAIIGGASQARGKIFKSISFYDRQRGFTKMIYRLHSGKTIILEAVFYSTEE